MRGVFCYHTPMFTKGNILDDNEYRGYIYGAFMEGLHKDDRAEVKFMKLDKTFTWPRHYQKTATKLDIIISGEALWEVDGQEVLLKKGDYIIVPPGVETAILKVIGEDTILQTIKVPSLPGDRVTSA